MLFISPERFISFSRHLNRGLDFLLMYKNGLIRKMELILKFLKSQPGKQMIAIHILPNISRSKDNPTFKFETGNWLGKECAVFGCSSTSYCFLNKERKPTGISFFKFPKSKAEINDWCNLVKRQNGKDDFVVKENSTYICSKYFHAADIYRAPGGTRLSLIKGSRLKLHSWNTSGEVLGESRKPPSYRTLSPRKKMRLDLEVSSNQKDNICDLSVQTGQKEVSESCNENTGLASC